MADDVNTSENPEKRLFVDEDWKSQVERERQAARHTDQAAAAGPQQAGAAGESEATLPPADLLFLIGTLYLQGVVALGLAPNPMSNKIEVRHKQARHAIDLLTMLQQKTEGNRTTDESAELEAVLHQLRLAYVGINEPPNTPAS